MTRHPTAEELATWMHGGSNDRIDNHLDQCETCADVCAEVLAEAEPLPPDVTRSLTADDALEDRVMYGVESTLVARSVGESFLGLLGLGVEAARIILGEETS